MENTEIKTGDVVFLKSSENIFMTVESIDTNTATCVFFHPITGTFTKIYAQLITLQKVSKTFDYNNKLIEFN